MKYKKILRIQAMNTYKKLGQICPLLVNDCISEGKNDLIAYYTCFCFCRYNNLPKAQLFLVIFTETLKNFMNTKISQ